MPRLGCYAMISSLGLVQFDNDRIDRFSYVFSDMLEHDGGPSGLNLP